MTSIYEPQGLSLDIFKKRYALHENESWVEACDRVAIHVATAENGELVSKWRSKFFDILACNLFIPGGRIMYGSGRPKGQLMNCFVIPTSDSREGWGKSVSDMIIICGTGGGLGINTSPIRPRGTAIHGTGGAATGAVSLFEIINAAGEVIKAGGGRRTALMFSLGLTHGDIEEFLDKKLDLKQLNNANVSVWFDENPEIFFNKVNKDQELELTFRGKVIGKVSAKKLWLKIVQNALKGGEPGLLNGYLFNKMSNISYYKPIICTNPCQPGWATVLKPEGVSQLGDLKVGDTIWSGKQWTKVSKIVNNGIKPVYGYYTGAGTFYGTENHRVVSNGVKVEVKDAQSIDVCPGLDPENDLSENAPNRILERKFISEEEVYDITVEADEHTYWSGGLLVSNCGEIGLIANDVCCLGALVLPRFVDNGEINYELLGNTVDTAVRFLDNVITVNNYPLPEIKETANDIRRIGLGVMGLHDLLLLLGMKYNSDKGLETIDHLMNFIKYRAYETSIELAKEKGAFPRFEADPYLKGGFAKKLKPSIRSKIKEFGIRNCALLTIAPTGTTSMVSGVTSGIEPMFAPAYERKYCDGDALKKEIVIHPLLKQFINEGRSVKHFQGAFDLKLKDHFEMQRICQASLDNACSKTINLPQGTSVETLSDLYMEFFPDLKGITVYPDGSREDQPLTPLPLDKAIELVNEAKEEVDSGKCRSGVCEL
jgi:ribonucleotide reductase alpha subunit